MQFRLKDLGAVSRVDDVNMLNLMDSCFKLVRPNQIPSLFVLIIIQAYIRCFTIQFAILFDPGDTGVSFI